MDRQNIMTTADSNCLCEGSKPVSYPLTRATGWLRGWLQHRYLPWFLALMAMLLCVPSLWLGRYFDDDFHRAALQRPEIPMIARSPAELFVFIAGNEQANRTSIAMGMLPWWASENLRIAFYRPVTGLTHSLDYRLWPELPSLMHLHSLLWFAGVILAAAHFYRRMIPAGWIAGLAALLFAFDDAHGLPAAWLANRNALIGAFFGLLALIAHDRWRRDKSWLAAILVPPVLLLGLLSKESTVAVAAYLASYALFLDRARWMRRLLSLMPAAVTIFAWWFYYKSQGYGVAGSDWYIDPAAEPGQFLEAVAARAPALLAWQWLVPSDLHWTFSDGATHTLWLVAIGLLVLIACAIAPIVKRSAVARFWAVGMVLAVPPACTAYPSDRLLTFVGIGGAGLLAQFVGVVIEGLGRMSGWSWRRLPSRVLCAFLLFIHLVTAPLALAHTGRLMGEYGSAMGHSAESLPRDTASRFQTVVIVNAPAYAVFAYGALTRLVEGDPYLSRTLVLGSSANPVEVTRKDRDTLLVRPRGGFLLPAGVSAYWDQTGRLLFDQRRAFLSFDMLYRDHRPMKLGHHINLLNVEVEITEVTADGRPAEAAFRFATGLDSPLYRWLQWQRDAFVPFTVPAVGESLVLPAAVMPWDDDGSGTQLSVNASASSVAASSGASGNTVTVPPCGANSKYHSSPQISITSVPRMRSGRPSVLKSRALAPTGPSNG